MTEGTSGLEQRTPASRVEGITQSAALNVSVAPGFPSFTVIAPQPRATRSLTRNKGIDPNPLWITGHNATNETTGFRSSLYRFDKD